MLYNLVHTQVGYQPIHLATMNGHIQMVEYLVSKSHDLMDAAVTVRPNVNCNMQHYNMMVKQNGALPIHFASLQGNVAMFKALTKLGSDPRTSSKDPVSDPII